MPMRTMRTIFGLLASWAVLATLSALAIVSLGGTGNWLSPSRQPAYGALTRVAAPMLPYRSDSGEPDPAHDANVAKLRLKAEDQELRSSRTAKPRSQPAPHTFATSRDSGRSFGGGAVTDRHSSNF